LWVWPTGAVSFVRFGAVDVVHVMDAERRQRGARARAPAPASPSPSCSAIAAQHTADRAEQADAGEPRLIARPHVNWY
jgi:hypothetical protein